MKFIPNSEIKNEMLKEIGCKNIDDLFSDIPKKIKIDDLDLDKGLSQQQVEKKLKKIACKNKSYSKNLCFLGGGVKPHYIPSVVKSIISRAEFYTAYTPYQSEASQGFLQAMFEYQSMIAELMGMDIANASLYDGATALGEAALMCTRVTKRKIFVVAKSICWEKKSVLKNYILGPGIEIREVGFDSKTGKIDVKELKKLVDDSVSGVYVENPNFFGVFEDDVEEIAGIVHDKGGLFVVGIDPVSLGVVKSPGDFGADIVIGEGRCFGNSMDFGGSSLGFFACKQDFVRNIPGRVIGLTVDDGGRRSFCMSLQTREQHIRRGRATSNICTNEGLCALSACVYLSCLGGNGLQDLGCVNFERGKRLADAICGVDGLELVFSGVHFNEFVIRYSSDAMKLHKRLLGRGVHGGLILDEWYPDFKGCMLFGITELYDDEDIECFVSVLKEVA